MLTSSIIFKGPILLRVIGHTSHSRITTPFTFVVGNGVPLQELPGRLAYIEGLYKICLDFSHYVLTCASSNAEMSETQVCLFLFAFSCHEKLVVADLESPVRQKGRNKETNRN